MPVSEAVQGIAGLLALLDVKSSISIYELREKLEEVLGIPAQEPARLVAVIDPKSTLKIHI